MLQFILIVEEQQDQQYFLILILRNCFGPSASPGIWASERPRATLPRDKATEGKHGSSPWVLHTQFKIGPRTGPII